MDEAKKFIFKNSKQSGGLSMGESDVKFVFRSSKAVSSLEQQENSSTYRIPMPMSVVPSSEQNSTAQKASQQQPPSITELRQ